MIHVEWMDFTNSLVSFTFGLWFVTRIFRKNIANILNWNINTLQQNILSFFLRKINLKNLVYCKNEKENNSMKIACNTI